MAELDDYAVTVKIDLEMTEKSRAVLRNELLNILSEPAVLQEFLKLLTQHASRIESGEDRAAT